MTVFLPLFLHWDLFGSFLTHSVALYRYGKNEFDIAYVMNGNFTLEKPPMKIYKGSKNVVLSREMIKFALNSQSSFKLQNWLQFTHVPDEHFYSTLAKFALNGVNRLKERIYTENECFRYSMWTYSSKTDKLCKGRVIRSICNFALADLRKISNSKCLSANKFNLEVSSTAVFCHMKHLLL